MSNFIIVLFKNKEKKKIINKYKTLKRANELFKKLIDESDNVIFDKKYENGISYTFELGLLSNNKSQNKDIFIKDMLGRQSKVSVENSDYVMTKVSDYKIEEYFWDVTKKKKINTKDLIKTYLKPTGLKLVSKLTNKIVIQNDDEFNLFTFKNEDDSSRFIDCLSQHFINEGRIYCMFVKDYSIHQRKFLYDTLEKVGYSKSYLQRYLTNHQVKK
jgi:hypothetical protein